MIQSLIHVEMESAARLSRTFIEFHSFPSSDVRVARISFDFTWFIQLPAIFCFGPIRSSCLLKIIPVWGKTEDLTFTFQLRSRGGPAATAIFNFHYFNRKSWINNQTKTETRACITFSPCREQYHISHALYHSSMPSPVDSFRLDSTHSSVNSFDVTISMIHFLECENVSCLADSE